MNKKFLFLIGFFLILIFLNSVFATLNVSLSDQGTDVKDKSTGNVLTLGDLSITIYDALSGGNLIYNETFVGAIVNGAWNVMLGENSSNLLPLEFGKIYYKDYAIDGLDLDFTDFQGNTVERQFFYSPLGDIAGEDISANADLEIASLNVTNTGLFDYLGSLADKITKLFVTDIDAVNIETSGNIDIGGDLNVTGTSYFADANFNNGWMNNGLSIINGDIYAQTGYFYNITSLNVSEQNLTIINDLIVYGNTELNQNLTVDTDTLFVDSNTNMVGIGTVSPDSILHLKSGVPYIILESTGTGDASYGYFIVKDSGGDTMGFAGFDSGINSDFTIRTTNVSDGIDFQTNGSNSRIYIKLDGNVGIGTMSPDDELDIEAQHSQMRLTDSDDDNFTQLSYSSDMLAFRNNNVSMTPILVIHDDSNVGIGTMSPINKLHIVDGEGTLPSWGTATLLAIQNNDNTTDTVRLALIGGIEGMSGIEFGDADDRNIGWISYNHDNDSMSFTTNASEHVRITDAGNVGIGTTSPARALTIGPGVDPYVKFDGGVGGTWLIGPGGTSRLRFINEGGGAGEAMVINSTNGNVGIGTTSPLSKLHLNNSGPVSIFISDGTETWQIDNGVESAGIFSITENGASRRLVIQNNTGNVGIGTTNPTHKLNVAGTFNTTSGGSSLIVDANGNVEIGI